MKISCVYELILCWDTLCWAGKRYLCWKIVTGLRYYDWIQGYFQINKFVLSLAYALLWGLMLLYFIKTRCFNMINVISWNVIVPLKCRLDVPLRCSLKVPMRYSSNLSWITAKWLKDWKFPPAWNKDKATPSLSSQKYKSKNLLVAQKELMTAMDEHSIKYGNLYIVP